MSNEFGVDEHGKAILWGANREQIMMEWEKKYMEECVDELCIKKTDRVLEIGFGLAYSATHIQSYRPASHTIIECDAKVLEHAHEFAKVHGEDRVIIVEGIWQRELSSLEMFDCVFFDDYPLPEYNMKVPKRSRWHDFMDAVLPHTNQGGRITGYLAREVDLSRPGCIFRLRATPVSAAANCTYYPHSTAFIPLVTVIESRATSSGAWNRLLAVREHLQFQQECLYQDDTNVIDTHEHEHVCETEEVDVRTIRLQKLRAKKLSQMTLEVL